MLVHEKTRLRPISHWTFSDVTFCKVGLYYSSASINQLFNSRNSFLQLLSRKATLKCEVLFKSVFFTNFFNKIVRRNVKLTRGILNLGSKIKHLSPVYKKKTSKSCADDSKASLVWVKKRTEHDLTLSPNLFFWASSTWCRRPKYFPYVHIYKAA